MKQQFLLIGLFITLFSACKKEGFNATTQATIDDDKIKAYIAANHIDVTKDAATGIYYKITNPGTGGSPNINDTVKITFTGILLNGTSFQSKSTSTDGILNFIKGFQIALPLMSLNTDSGKTCRMRLIVPSALAYGNNVQSGDTTIPSNSPLDFTIDLQGYYGPQ
jgi:FKBP-type peptidyl-prolyl cis-trans isomerase FkpA